MCGFLQYDRSLHMIIFRKMPVQPVSVKNANAFCSRVVYIDLIRDNEDILPDQWSRIRAKLTNQMQRLNWYPQTVSTSFIFYKRDDAAGWSPEDEVEQAIRATQAKYGTARFQFAILKPIGVPEGFENTETAFRNLFNNANE